MMTWTKFWIKFRDSQSRPKSKEQEHPKEQLPVIPNEEVTPGTTLKKNLVREERFPTERNHKKAFNQNIPESNTKNERNERLIESNESPVSKSYVSSINYSKESKEKRTKRLSGRSLTPNSNPFNYQKNLKHTNNFSIIKSLSPNNGDKDKENKKQKEAEEPKEKRS